MVQVETERKFEIGPEDTIPEQLGSVVEVTNPQTWKLRARYFDDADYSLVRARISLRHRLGGPDHGWHLKWIASETSRYELHAPGSNTKQIPAALLQELNQQAQHGELRVVARLETVRTQSDLKRDGKLIAYLCDDRVLARSLSQYLSWRELEVELVEGDIEDLDEITKVLEENGVNLSERHAKVGTVLAREMETTRVEEAIADYWRAQCEELAEWLGRAQLDLDKESVRAIRWNVASLIAIQSVWLSDLPDSATVSRLLQQCLAIFLEPSRLVRIDQALAELGSGSRPDTVAALSECQKALSGFNTDELFAVLDQTRPNLEKLDWPTVHEQLYSKLELVDHTWREAMASRGKLRDLLLAEFRAAYEVALAVYDAIEAGGGSAVGGEHLQALAPRVAAEHSLSLAWGWLQENSDHARFEQVAQLRCRELASIAAQMPRLMNQTEMYRLTE